MIKQSTSPAIENVKNSMKESLLFYQSLPDNWIQWLAWWFYHSKKEYHSQIFQTDRKLINRKSQNNSMKQSFLFYQSLPDNWIQWLAWWCCRSKKNITPRYFKQIQNLLKEKTCVDQLANVLIQANMKRVHIIPNCRYHKIGTKPLALMHFM